MTTEQKHISPFKFLDSYTEADRDIFFGRDREVEELYNKTYHGNLLLVYGASGTGKSSIINCGLANKFSDSDWLPINVRRGGDIMRSMYSQIEKSGVTSIETPEKISKESIANAVQSVYLDHFKPIYLVFDQFEELFIFGYQDEWQSFIESVRYMMDADLDVHFIFVIRGEYLEFLSEFEETIPEFFDNRMRVEKMTRKNALESISGPCNLYSIELEEGFEEKLLRTLSPDKAHIELTFLQVYLDRIFRNAVEGTNAEEPVRFGNEAIDRVGQVGDVLAEFLDEQLFRMENSREALQVLKSFVSLQGTKTRMTLEQVIQRVTDLGSSLEPEGVENILTGFVNKRILNEKDENGLYELRHDSLAQKVFEKISHQEREMLDVRQFISYSFNEYEKRGILLNDEDLVYIAPFLKSLSLPAEVIEFIELSRKKSARQQRTRRTRTILTLVILGFTILSVAGFIYSQWQKAEIENLAELAQNESEEAGRQRALAEEQRSLAVSNAEQARQQAVQAMQAREEAMRQARIAEEQRAIALTQQQLADDQRQVADEERTRAERNAEVAIEQTRLAEEQRLEANRLRMVSLAREIAIKSQFHSDPVIKGLLAMQALDYNTSYSGSNFNPDIYLALLSARKSLLGESFNQAKVQERVIKSILAADEKLFTAGAGSTVYETNLVAPIVRQSEFQTGFTVSILGSNSAGDKLFAGSRSGAVRYFQNGSQEFLFSRQNHEGEVTGLLYAENSGQLYSTGKDGKIIVLDNRGALLDQLDLGEHLLGIRLLKDQERLVVATESGRVILLNSELNIQDEFQYDNDGALTAFDITDKGKMAALGYENGTLLLADIEMGSVVRELPSHLSGVTSVTFDLTGTYFASSGFDRTIRVWRMDMLQSQPILLEDHDNWISEIEFSEKGDRIFCGTYSGTLYTYPLNTNELAEGICEIAGRNITQEEWNDLIGKEHEYKQVCNDD